MAIPLPSPSKPTMASAQRASFWARTFPKANARFTQFKGTQTYDVAAWTWKHKRSIVFGVSTSYIAYSYFITKLKIAESNEIKPNTYLIWKFYPGSIVETKGPPSLSHLFASQTSGEDPPRVITIFEAVQALTNAAADPNIRGLYGDFSTLSWPTNVASESLGLAQIEELATAIHHFKEAKAAQFPPPEPKDNTLESKAQSEDSSTSPKTPDSPVDPKMQGLHKALAATLQQSTDEAAYIPSTIAFADTFVSQSNYLLASAFEKVYLQPSGNVPLTGVSSSMPFFARLLNKLGIKVNATARREYKSMISPAIRDDGLTQPQLENQAHLLGELNNNVAYAIGVSRFPNEDPQQAADKVMRLMCDGPFSAKEAKELGLVDDLLYKADVARIIHGGRDFDVEREAFHQLNEGKDPLADSRMKFKTLPHYSSMLRQTLEQADPDQIVDIAVCYLRGTIASAAGEDSASAVIKGLREAAMDDKIKAIIVRMDSGGGDVVASECVWHAIKNVRESCGKPVVVSFGNVAASGAYYAATAADVILASESTITGSIGVASIRPTITRKLFDQAGVAVQSFFTGAKTDSILYEADAQQLARQETHIDEMYGDFLQRVMDGRGISQEVVEDIAGGRVYTGLAAWCTTHSPSDKTARPLSLEAERTFLLSKPEYLAQHVVRLTEAALNTPTSASTAMPGDTSQSHYKVLARGEESLPLDTICEWELQDYSEPTEFDAQRIVKRVMPKSNIAADVTGEGVQAVQEAIESLKEAVSSPAREGSTASADPATAAHAEASESRLEDKDDSAGEHAAASAASEPFGRGLVDGIGGMLEAVEHAASLTMASEIHWLMIKEGLSEQEAKDRIRPKARGEDGLQPSQGGVVAVTPRITKYPRPKSFRERLHELQMSGGAGGGAAASMALSGLWLAAKEELSAALARALVSAVTLAAQDPTTTLREMRERLEESGAAAQGGATKTRMEYDGGRPRL